MQSDPWASLPASLGALKGRCILAIGDFSPGPRMARHELTDAFAQWVPTVLMSPPPGGRDVFRHARAPWQSMLTSTGERSYRFQPGAAFPVLHRSGPLARLVARRFITEVNRRLLAAGLGAPIPYFWGPYRGSLAEAAGDPVCYHSYDAVDAYIGADGEVIRAQERAILGRASVVFASSRQLVERVGRQAHVPVHEIDHAVDVTLYASGTPEPEVLASVAHPRFVYAGRLSPKFDFDLVDQIASRMPHASLVLAGPVMAVSTSAFEGLTRRANVHYLGVLPPQQVPALLMHCDVGLMPYRLDGHVQFSQPLKHYQFLAARLPSVAVPVPALMGKTGVTIAANPAQWVEALHSASQQDAEARAGLFEIAKNNSWQSRALRILDVINDHLADAPHRLTNRPERSALGSEAQPSC